jgi:hypothetical protein
MSSKSTAVAVFDISSSSVGGAHALLDLSSHELTGVTILVQERRDSGLDDELNIDRFIENTAKALEVVISHVRTADVHHPEIIQVVLSSPWYIPYTRVVTYNKTTLFKCTERLVDSLIEKEIEHLLKQPTDTGEILGNGFRVVERQLSQIKLNGYETTDPYGKKVQSLELTLTITVVPEVVVERFQTILRRSYGDRTINVTTSPYATFVALRDNGGVPSDCAIIDVGEEVTDIAFIKNDILLYQHSFPVGTYGFYRELSASTGSSVEARASQCYITADARFENIFPAIIENDTFLLHTAATSAIQARFVSAQDFSSTVHTSSSDPADAALAIAALFSERLL